MVGIKRRRMHNPVKESFEGTLDLDMNFESDNRKRPMPWEHWIVDVCTNTRSITLSRFMLKHERY